MKKSFFDIDVDDLIKRGHVSPDEVKNNPILIHSEYIGLYINPLFEKVFDIKKSDIVGISLLKNYISQEVSEYLNKHLSEDNPNPYFVKIKNKDTVIQSLVRKFSYKNKNLRLVIFKLYDFESNEKKNELNPLQINYKELTENSFTGIWVIDKAGNTLYANPILFSIFDIESKDELKDIAFKDLLIKKINSIYKSEKVSYIILNSYNEIEIKSQKGINKNILHSSKPYYNESNEHIGYIITLLDVTYRRELEKKLKSSNLKLKEVLAEKKKKLTEETFLKEQNEKGIRYLIDGLGKDFCDLIFNVNGTLEYISSTSIYVFGVSPEQAVGNTSSVVNWDEESNIRAKKKIKEIIKTKKPVKPFILTFELNGRKKYIRNWERPILDAHGNVTHIHAISVDITKSIELQNKLKNSNSNLIKQKSELSKTITNLKKTQEELIESEKMASIGILIAGFLHKIKNIVNNINSGSAGLQNSFEKIQKSIEQLLMDQINTQTDTITNKKFQKFHDLMNYNADFTEMMQCINAGVKEMVDIIESIKYFAEDNNAKVQECNLNDVISDVKFKIDNSGNSNISIVTSLEKLPLIKGNYDNLFQAIYNITNNAVAASHDGGVVHISSHYGNKMVVVSIEDNGQGIKKEIRNRIFEPFFTTKSSNKGVGLGLYISASIIKQMKGNISYTSSEKGTIFKIEFPIK